ncbi:MAG: hypothetical protein A3F16_04615 [Deltaproteobacteria bacterium RIFCSPHIGHO2_12_FULL_43_9]|nr:MAG: hypothetical protein A3F16_04615 [Deltaproteobacteria bacterium RIFCSPHIGHO2_12_FULL_43_9]
MLQVILLLLIQMTPNAYARFELPASRRNLSHYSCPKEYQATNRAKVAFFDADSTLRISKSRSVTANKEDDVLILPFVARKIQELNDRGYLIAIVSNQGGVKTNKEKFQIAQGAILHTIQQLARLGARVDYFDFAEFLDDHDINDGFRKPAIRMATTLGENLKTACKNDDLRIDKGLSFMVGDSATKPDDVSDSDRTFAENFKITFFEPKDFFGWANFGITDINHDKGEKNKDKKLPLLIERIEREIGRLEETNENPERHHELVTESTNLKRINQFSQILRLVHFNIKELTTAKLNDESNRQVESATNTISSLNPDFISFNEIQYDLPFVPTVEQPDSKGKNLERLIEKIILNRNIEFPSWGYTFEEANTGRNARKRDGINYFEDPNDPEARNFADQVNFGVFPGQYSTGFASKFPIAERRVYSDIPWKTWNPSIDLEKFTLNGKKQLPTTTELFDKNFNHSIVIVNDKKVHFITFHTVPAYGFGSPTTPNFERNRDQLEFLKWYLTGECVKQYGCNATGIEPIPYGEPFIAVGDFNVDINSDNLGAEVLKSLFIHPDIQRWFPDNWDPAFRNKTVTFLSDGVDLGETTLQQQLDYILISKHFKILNGEVFVPKSEFKEYGCFNNIDEAINLSKEVKERLSTQHERYKVEVTSRWIKMFAGNSKLFCVISTTNAFSEFRNGSDHLPIYVDFELDNTF